MLKKIIAGVICIGLAFIPAIIGSLATVPNIPTWYAQLDKPPLNPPNWVFGPVWTLLYALTGISLYLLWRNPSDNKSTVYGLFISQAILNALWSVVFFGMHQPGLGLVIIILLASNLVLSIIKFRSLSSWAAYLFIPYLLWVCFAAYLNLGVVLLN